jgi:hypothetical protein
MFYTYTSFSQVFFFRSGFTCWHIRVNVQSVFLSGCSVVCFQHERHTGRNERTRGRLDEALGKDGPQATCSVVAGLARPDPRCATARARVVWLWALIHSRRG